MFMKILVTGGAGMVGSHCAEYFSDQGHNVLVIDNLMRSEIFGVKRRSVEFNWLYLEKEKGIQCEKIDVRNANRMDRAFQKFQPDVVIHCASQPGVRTSIANPIDDFSINCIGTLNALEALRKCNKDGIFLYCSTNKVYGSNVDQFSLREHTARYEFDGISGVTENVAIDETGHTPYGVSKLVGDLYAQDYAHTFGLKTAVFRMSCIYGTRQFGFEDQGWLAWFCIRMLQGKAITLFGNGKQLRDVLWVNDLVKAFEKFIYSPIDHGVFNIGGGPDNTLSLLELIQLLEEITKKRVPIRKGNWREFDQKVYVSSIEKVERLLDWRPQISPKIGVKLLADWIFSNKELFSKEED